MNELIAQLRAVAEKDCGAHYNPNDEHICGIAAIELENAENIKKLYELELAWRMNIFITILRTMTNGEWDKLYEIDPGLHDSIRQAIERQHS